MRSHGPTMKGFWQIPSCIGLVQIGQLPWYQKCNSLAMFWRHCLIYLTPFLPFCFLQWSTSCEGDNICLICGWAFPYFKHPLFLTLRPVTNLCSNYLLTTTKRNFSDQRVQAFRFPSMLCLLLVIGAVSFQLFVLPSLDSSHLES